MKSILIRDVPQQHIAALDELARQSGQSRQDYLLAAVANLVGDFSPQMCLGYFKLERPGDIDPISDCPECGQALAESWMYVMGDKTLGGPICGDCATSE